MNMHALTKKRSILVIAIIAILAVSLFAVFQGNKGAQAAVIDPHFGLVAWLQFDEGAGAVVGDSSGNNNNGTVQGAIWVSGKTGTALSFNGVDSFVNIPTSSGFNFGTTVDFTISCWLKTDQSGVNQYFLVKDYGLPGYWDFFISSANVLRFASSDGQPSLSGTINVADGSWHFVSVACDRNGQSRLYVDGVPDGSAQTMIGGSVSSSSPIRVGSTNAGTVWFEGSIDEISIYNRALSSSEILNEFQTGKGRPLQLGARIPKGTTQVITTLTWQGPESINATITSPSQTYSEDGASVSVYQKSTYSTASDTTLNIKRISITVSALSADENWAIALTMENSVDYTISVEAQK
jgi:hypothetical protein